MKSKSITDQLRAAIRGYGSIYAVARDSGIRQSMLQRFMTDGLDIRLQTADRLCEFFGMHLTGPTTRPPRKS